MWEYEDSRAALVDALRLSRAMTYKAAVAGLPLGGGKGVIVIPAGTRLSSAHRHGALLDFAETVDALGGSYVLDRRGRWNVEPGHARDRGSHAARCRASSRARRLQSLRAR